MAVENWQQPAIGAGAALLGSIPQMVEARRLRKERDRLMKEGAPGMTPIEQQQMAEARARAASSQVPGYGQELENINQQQGNILGEAKKAGVSSSNLLNMLSRLNQQGQAARRNLAIRGAQAQRSAQSEFANMALTADARRQGRVQNWEAKMAAMDAARRQYNAQAGMAPIQGAIAFMPTEGLKFGGKAKPTAESVRFNPETDTQFGEEMNVSGANMQALNPTTDMTGLGEQFNMSEDIGYDPYKTPSLRRPTEFTNAMYENMFNPNAARQRRNLMNSRLLNVKQTAPQDYPYYNFGQ